MRPATAAWILGERGPTTPAELDHGLQRTWLRPRAIEAFGAALERTRR